MTVNGGVVARRLVPLAAVLPGPLEDMKVPSGGRAPASRSIS